VFISCLLPSVMRSSDIVNCEIVNLIGEAAWRYKCSLD